MNSRSGTRLFAAAGAAGVLCVTFALCAEPPSGATDRPKADKPAIAAAESEGTHRVSVVVARERAKLMHDIYASTLNMIHHRYFRADTSNVPARALEDVFSDMARQSQVKAKWISVNTKAMSIDHEPQGRFEEEAAAAIGSGKNDFELVEDGYYRRAGAIHLTAGCVGCHTRFFTTPPRSPRFAGLVISIPVNDE